MKRFDGHSVEDIIVATGFALTLLTFVLGDFFTCLRGGNPTQIENRRASEFPTISRNFSNIAAFPKLFERYLEDRMAFKSQLVAARSLIKWKVFGVSASDQVLIGKFGFLFLYAGNNKFLTHGTYTFTEEELWAWQALLEKRSQWCHSHNVDYYFVLAPYKQSVYPELLPNGYQHKKGPTRADQLVEFMRKHSPNVHFLDLRAAMIAHKGKQALYLKTDTHWSVIGAYVGYQALIDLIRQKWPQLVPPPPFTVYKTNKSYFDNGDLTRVLGLRGIVNEVQFVFKACYPWPHPGWPISDYSKKYGRTPDPECDPLVVEQPDSKLPRAVIFRDSFADYWLPYLPTQFSEVLFVWQPTFDYKLVQEQHADIVIQEMVELMLYDPVPES